MDAAKPVEPVKVEKVDGTDAKRLTLEPAAFERLGIKTAPVTAAAVPAGAILYDPRGTVFVYVNPAPLVFTRLAVAVDRFDGDVAVLSAGPSEGTPVVVVGGAELTGIEFGVGK